MKQMMNMPWEERPEGCTDVMWRYSKNPVIGRYHIPVSYTHLIRRTYPNMMTREGARGMEWNAWSEGNPPEHHVLLPFTRLLSGPMDYTPEIFDILYELSLIHIYRCFGED